MYVGHFFSQAGKYHTRIYMKDRIEVVELVFRYLSHVPRILVCDSSDCAVVDRKPGQWAFLAPEFQFMSRLISEVPPVSIPSAGDSDLEAFLTNTIEEIKKLCREYVRIGKKVLSMPFAHPAYVKERMILAIAARDELNLYNYQYVQVDDYLTQLVEAEDLITA